jgi:hypothetical protein
MNTPRDDWDADERDVLESDGFAHRLEEVRAHHALGPDDQARLLARIQREARASKPAPSTRWRRWAVPIAAAAGILIAAIVILRDRDSALVKPSDAPAPAVAAAKPSPVFYLPLEKPAIKISPAALGYRGPGGENSLLADLKPAFDAFRANDYERADREFSALSARYPKSVEIAFHQGIARMFIGDMTGAIASLAAAERLADSSLAWDVAWYPRDRRRARGESGGRAREARPIVRTGGCARQDRVRRARAPAGRARSRALMRSQQEQLNAARLGCCIRRHRARIAHRRSGDHGAVGAAGDPANLRARR